MSNYWFLRGSFNARNVLILEMTQYLIKVWLSLVVKGRSVEQSGQILNFLNETCTGFVD